MFRTVNILKTCKSAFFRRSKGHYDLANKVHENVIVDGESQRAQHDIYHYGESSIFVKVEKNNQYSNLKALEKYQKESLQALQNWFW